LFEPLNLRGEQKYHNLEAHGFTSDEKEALIALIDANKKIPGGVSMRQICRRYNLARSTVQAWSKRVHANLPLYDSVGNPFHLSHKKAQEVSDELKEARKGRRSLNRIIYYGQNYD